MEKLRSAIRVILDRLTRKKEEGTKTLVLYEIDEIPVKAELDYFNQIAFLYHLFGNGEDINKFRKKLVEVYNYCLQNYFDDKELNVFSDIRDLPLKVAESMETDINEVKFQIAVESAKILNCLIPCFLFWDDVKKEVPRSLVFDANKVIVEECEKFFEKEYKGRDFTFIFKPEPANDFFDNLPGEVVGYKVIYQLWEGGPSLAALAPFPPSPPSDG